MCGIQDALQDLERKLCKRLVGVHEAHKLGQGRGTAKGLHLGRRQERCHHRLIRLSTCIVLSLRLCGRCDGGIITDVLWLGQDKHVRFIFIRARQYEHISIFGLSLKP